MLCEGPLTHFYQFVARDRHEQPVAQYCLRPLHLEHLFAVASLDLPPPHNLVEVVAPFVVLLLPLHVGGTLLVQVDFRQLLEVGLLLLARGGGAPLVLRRRVVHQFAALRLGVPLLLFELVDAREEPDHLVGVVHQRGDLLVLQLGRLSRVLRRGRRGLFAPRRVGDVQQAVDVHLGARRLVHFVQLLLLVALLEFGHRDGPRGSLHDAPVLEVLRDVDHDLAGLTRLQRNIDGLLLFPAHGAHEHVLHALRVNNFRFFARPLLKAVLVGGDVVLGGEVNVEVALLPAEAENQWFEEAADFEAEGPQLVFVLHFDGFELERVDDLLVGVGGLHFGQDARTRLVYVLELPDDFFAGLLVRLQVLVAGARGHVRRDELRLRPEVSGPRHVELGGVEGNGGDEALELVGRVFQRLQESRVALVNQFKGRLQIRYFLVFDGRGHFYGLFGRRLFRRGGNVLGPLRGGEGVERLLSVGKDARSGAYGWGTFNARH